MTIATPEANSTATMNHEAKNKENAELFWKIWSEKRRKSNLNLTLFESI